jgi:hypothetical protein
MHDETTIPRVAKVMARRVADRIGTVLDEEPRALARRLADLDGWTLETMLRLTRDRVDAAAHRRHLGVVGVDHSLNRLVVESARESTRERVDLEAVDLEALDDEDLISAAHYVPETLPGYMLG